MRINRPLKPIPARVPTQRIDRCFHSQKNLDLPKEVAAQFARLLSERGLLMENTNDPTRIPFRIEQLSFGWVVTGQLALAALTGSEYPRFADAKPSKRLVTSLSAELIPVFAHNLSSQATALVKNRIAQRLNNRPVFFVYDHLLITRQNADHKSVFNSVYMSFAFSNREFSVEDRSLQEKHLVAAREQDIPLDLFIRFDVTLLDLFAQYRESESSHRLVHQAPKLKDTQIHVVYVPWTCLPNSLFENKAGNSKDSEFRAVGNKPFYNAVAAHMRATMQEGFMNVGQALAKQGIAPYYPYSSLSIEEVVVQEDLAGFVVGFAFSRDPIPRSEKRKLQGLMAVEAAEKARALQM